MAGGLGHLSSLSNGRVYHYNGLGQRTTEGPSANPSETTYSWRGQRLVSMSGPRGGGAYSYDAYGQRVKSVVTSGSVTTTTKYDYDGNTLLGLSASRSDGATYTVDYLYDNDNHVFAGVYKGSDTTAGIPFEMVTTDKGDVRELLDAQGNSFAFYAYDAYGNPTPAVTATTSLIPSAAIASAITTRQPLRYASYVYDNESGLYYLAARYYDPSTMQFISRDPAKADGEQGLYQYCGGDPVNLVDPDGNEPHEYNDADGYGSSGYSHGYDHHTHTSMRDANRYAEEICEYYRERRAERRAELEREIARERADEARIRHNREVAIKRAKIRAAARAVAAALKNAAAKAAAIAKAAYNVWYETNPLLPPRNADEAGVKLTAGAIVGTFGGALLDPQVDESIQDASARIAAARENSPVDIPEGHVGRIADNGRGVVFEDPAASVRNANSIRIMDDGYYRWYNKFGQPMDVDGRPGPPNATHIRWR